MKPFKIRDVEISPPLVLSPMAGVTDVPFRALLKRRGGIGLTVSEFISVEGLTRNNPKSKRQMRFHEFERPFAVQIFGGQPPRMRMAAEMAEEVGADILDVNCGCPAPKVVKHGGGSGLLRDLPRLETILKEIKKSISIPLTVKIRAGFYRQDSGGLLRPHAQRGRGGAAGRSLRRRAHRAPRADEGAGLQGLGRLGFGQAGEGGGERPRLGERRRRQRRRRFQALARDRV
jgi:tRNA-dihydrouridine synthase